ncbi:MAG: amidase family protein [Actinomycetota bacterium]
MIPPLSEEELERLAALSFLHLERPELEEYKRLTDELLEVVADLDWLPARLAVDEPPVPATRRLGAPRTEENDPLNAVVRWCDVKAEVDGPLSGWTVALKDSIAVAGIPLSCGSRVLQGFVPTTDSVVADRILRAGGRIVAMTNMDDFAFSGGGDSSVYGPTLNPFNAARTAGGSSSGSAAALHYEGIDVAVGTDQGGSIRLPAAWCAVVGLKPTYGLVPYTGIVAIDQSVDHVGPLARRVTDLALLLQTIEGYDPTDPRQTRSSPAEDYVRAATDAPATLEGVRLGIVEEGFSEDVEAEQETRAAVEEAIERMRAIGAATVAVSLPEHLLAGPIAFGGAFEGMTALLRAGGNGYEWRGRYWPELATAMGTGLREHANDLSPQVKVTLLLGEYLRERYFGSVYARAQNLKQGLRRAYDRPLAEVDFLLMPTAPRRPHQNDPSLSISERVLRGWAVLANTTPTDLTGHPAISVPVAEAEGLPVGVMAVGRHGHDADLIRLASTCERTLGWKPG